MPVKRMDIREAQARLPDLLTEVQSGVEWVLLDGDKPVARLVPVASAETRVAGLHARAIQASPDFDEPLPEAFWTGQA